MFQRLRDRFERRQNWPTASASISSVEYITSSRGDPAGFYEAAYSFWVDGHVYGGEYVTDYDVKTDDTIDIRYNPKDPNINFNPEDDFVYQHGLPSVLAIAGVVVAIAIGLFLLNR